MRIETRRLLLRPLEQADFSALQKILGDPRVMYAWEHGFGDAEVRDWITRSRARYAREGVKSQNSLINEFKKIYRRLAKVQTKQDLEGKNWKEVLNIKFNEVVKVKRVNDVLSPQNEAENENNFKKINEEVKNGNLQQALDGLHQLDSSFIVNDPAMQKWMAEVQARINFNQAIANISAHSLALMKVNSIKSN